MQSIERIGAPAQHELNGSDGYIATMRDFLSKPRVARDFQDLKADAERLRAIAYLFFVLYLAVSETLIWRWRQARDAALQEPSAQLGFLKRTNQL